MARGTDSLNMTVAVDQDIKPQTPKKAAHKGGV